MSLLAIKNGMHHAIHNSAAKSNPLNNTQPMYHQADLVFVFFSPPASFDSLKTTHLHEKSWSDSVVMGLMMTMWWRWVQWEVMAWWVLWVGGNLGLRRSGLVGMRTLSLGLLG